MDKKGENCVKLRGRSRSSRKSSSEEVRRQHGSTCADCKFKKKIIHCILDFILGRSNCIVLRSFVHELPKGEIVRILCWLNSWVGQNSRGPLSYIS